MITYDDIQNAMEEFFPQVPSTHQEFGELINTDYAGLDRWANEQAAEDMSMTILRVAFAQALGSGEAGMSVNDILDKIRTGYTLGYAMGWTIRGAVGTQCDDAITKLHGETQPLAGRPGWRSDEQGREFYSSAWLD